MYHILLSGVTRAYLCLKMCSILFSLFLPPTLSPSLYNFGVDKQRRPSGDKSKTISSIYKNNNALLPSS